MYEELIRDLRDPNKPVDCNAVADAIEDLIRRAAEWEVNSESWQKACKGLEERMPRWIPAMERLPEEDGEYLTWFCVDVTEPNFGIFPFDANVHAFGYWDDYYDPVTCGWAESDFIEIEGITHWMPLPQPPKEGQP